MAGSGALAGPVAGGALVEQFSWRAGFWLNVPVVVVAVAGAWCWVPESRHPRPGRGDGVGMTLVTGGLLALVWAIIEAPVRGWADPLVMTAFAAAAGILMALAWWERRHPSPLIPVALCRNGRFSAAALALAFMFFALFGALFIISLYLQTVLGHSPAQTGWLMLPLAGATGCGAGLSLLIAPRWGDKIPVTAGMALVATGFIILANAPAESGYGPVLLFQLTAGCGAGLAAAPATEAIMGAVPTERAGTGAALNDLVREVGGALGIAALGTALTTAHHKRLEQHTGHDAASLPLTHLVNGSQASRPAAQHAEVLQQAFTAGVQAASWTGAAACLIATAITWLWLPHRQTTAQPGATADIPPQPREAIP